MYIDRKALLNRLEAIKESADWDSPSKYVLFGIKEFINNAPAADVVEVVRCRDCKSYCPESITVVKHCAITGVSVDDNDFCSYGERKENNV